MIFFVYHLESLALDVRVYLGRGYVRVSQHNLDRSQVGAALEEVGRERMPEGMGTYLSGYARFERVILYYLPEALARHASPEPRDEERFRFPTLEHRRPRRPQVFEELLPRLIPHWDNPLLVPLAVNYHEPELEIYVVELEPH